MIGRLRRATEEDFRFYHRREPPAGWQGFVYEHEGIVCAMASVWIDDCAHAWVSVDQAHLVPRFTLHRMTLTMLKEMGAAGIPAVYTICDTRIPRAEAWMRRLGFVVDAHMPQVYMPELGYHAPVWTKALRDAVDRS